MDAHDLYGLPLDRFVPERTALARELRKAGERDDAEAVAALRKPSVAAWAVNQLVRTQGRAIAALFDAGDAVQNAQASLVAGQGDSTRLRQALNEEREAVAELVAVARGLLTSEGQELSPATLERVSQTLDAGALDEEARTQIRDGCLHRELRRVGLGAAPVSEPQGKKPKPPARRRDKDLAAQRKAQSDARRAAERAREALEEARASRDAAAQALQAAEAALAEAAERSGLADAALAKADRKPRSSR